MINTKPQSGINTLLVAVWPAPHFICSLHSSHPLIYTDNSLTNDGYLSLELLLEDFCNNSPEIFIISNLLNKQIRNMADN
jgi:hypothetical protein